MRLSIKALSSDITPPSPATGELLDAIVIAILAVILCLGTEWLRAWLQYRAAHRRWRHHVRVHGYGSAVLPGRGNRLADSDRRTDS